MCMVLVVSCSFWLTDPCGFLFAFYRLILLIKKNCHNLFPWIKKKKAWRIKSCYKFTMGWSVDGNLKENDCVERNKRGKEGLKHLSFR